MIPTPSTISRLLGISKRITVLSKPLESLREVNGFIYTVGEAIHSQVIGFEMEYAFDATPSKARELKPLLEDRGNIIDSYGDINSAIIRELSNYSLSFLDKIVLESSPMGLELVTKPLSMKAAGAIAPILSDIITFLESCGYSASVGNPGLHANINRDFFNTYGGIIKFVSSSFLNIDLINDLSGRLGKNQFRSDIYHLLGDTFFETDLLSFVEERSVAFAQQVFENLRTSLMGLIGQPSSLGYRIEVRWFATAKNGEDFLLKALFFYKFAEFCSETQDDFYLFMQNNVGLANELMLYLQEFNRNNQNSIK